VEALIRDALDARPSGPGESTFAVASNPEFLREGTALRDSLYPDRVVVGSDHEHALEVLYTLYRPVLEQSFRAPTFLPRPEGLGAAPLVATDIASAELIKYAANAFLALKVSYINEVSQLAEKVGADVGQVAKGIGLDARIGTRFLQAGIGWGGSCFAKDTAALLSTASEYGLDMPIVAAAREVNARQRTLVVTKLLAELKILSGHRIALLGLAFKPHTDDLRDAPAFDIARHLIEKGAIVEVHDPVALARARAEHPDLDIRYCDTPEETMKNASAVVLVTDWPQYRELDWPRLAPTMRNPLLIDGRNFLNKTKLIEAGFRYVAIGA
jgi:UDPglucose 6-dehydrogenase